MSNKKITVVNPELVATGPAVVRLGDDLFRKEFGAWQRTEQGLSFVPGSPLGESSNFNTSYIIESGISPPELTKGLDNPTTTKQTVTIIQGPNAITDKDAFETRVKSFISITSPFTSNDFWRTTDGKFLDYAATLDSYMTTEEALNVDVDVPGAISGVDYMYNYLDIAYETLLRTVTDHKVIPSMSELLKETYISGVGFEENVLKAPTARILQRNINGTDSSGAPLPPIERFANQLVPSENNGLLKDYKGNSYLFPMYTQINIPFAFKTQISNAVSDSRLGCLLSRDVHGAYTSAPSTISEETLEYSYSYYNREGQKRVDYFSAPSKTVDLERWLDEDAPAGGSPLPSNWMYVGPETTSADVADGTSPIAVADGINILKSRLEQVTQENQRTFKDLLEGRESYSETLMYKVTKFLGTGIENPIQTFYFMNSMELFNFMNEEREISFVDTQVKYNEVYTYSVIAYQAIIGTKYVYKNLQVYDPSDDGLAGPTISIALGIPGLLTAPYAKVDVQMAPLVKIVEMPLFMSVGKILSFPPLSPELSFIPYRGKPDQLLFHFNTNTGKEDQVPVMLTAQEESNVAQISFNQKRKDGKITFQTDDHNIAFQIYRTDKPPTSYADFSKNLLTIASTASPDSRINLQAGSTSALIKQVTNKKYYYMFRSVDFHGDLSNPSVVYEIELYNDSGVGYPIIRQYEFGSADPKTTTKSARKIIQIIPRISQAYLNEKESNLINDDGTINTAINKDISLGLEDESLFATTSGLGSVTTGKRFKIRLTSKSTGKKVDINVDFKTNRVAGAIE